MMTRTTPEEQKDLKAEVNGLQLQIHEQEQQEKYRAVCSAGKEEQYSARSRPLIASEACQGVLSRCTPDKSIGKRRQRYKSSNTDL